MFFQDRKMSGLSDLIHRAYYSSGLDAEAVLALLRPRTREEYDSLNIAELHHLSEIRSIDLGTEISCERIRELLIQNDQVDKSHAIRRFTCFFNETSQSEIFKNGPFKFVPCHNTEYYILGRIGFQSSYGVLDYHLRMLVDGMYPTERKNFLRLYDVFTTVMNEYSSYPLLLRNKIQNEIKMTYSYWEEIIQTAPEDRPRHTLCILYSTGIYRLYSFIKQGLLEILQNPGSPEYCRSLHTCAVYRMETLTREIYQRLQAYTGIDRWLLQDRVSSTLDVISREMMNYFYSLHKRPILEIEEHLKLYFEEYTRLIETCFA